MNRMLLAAVFVMLISVACSTAATLPDQQNPTIDPDAPVSSDDPTQPTVVPTPREGEWISGQAVVEELDIRFLESWPLQIHVGVRGTIGDGCTELDEIVTTREENTFYIDVTTARPADAVCTDIARVFEENIPLEVYGLLAGTYTVNANGTTATFTLDQDNILDPTAESAFPPEGQPSGQFTYGLAHVTGVTVTTSAQPPSAEVTISGWLPSPCDEITEVREDFVGNALRLTVESRAPADMACAAMIQEFTITHTIRQLPGPGTYTLVVNDVATQFTIQ